MLCRPQIFFGSLIFIFAFLLNFIWEEFHSFLYLTYQGETITHFILMRAALADAIFISILFSLAKITKRNWLFPALAILLAVLIEWWALGSGRWVYSSLMPVVPILQVGLSPLVQLVATGILSQKIINFFNVDFLMAV